MERTSDVSREVVLVIQAFIILFVISERLLPATLSPATLLRTWRTPRAHTEEAR